MLFTISATEPIEDLRQIASEAGKQMAAGYFKLS